MRSGGCTVQHTLTAEAAGVVKHAVALARQRGHAQVTPLHVAATLLPPGCASLLHRACLKSHPHSAAHPLQCRALELCFKVALNRLPTTAGSLVQPSLSNSLVAVLKRAQANQRRGCVEQQQQPPLLGVKVETEQLIISILDDPSVSRVMREAGFSSTCVKNKLEEESVVSITFPNEISRSAKGLMAEAVDVGGGVVYTHNQNSIINNNNARFNFLESPVLERLRSVKNKDVESVLEVLLGKKSRRINSVIVGDCFLTTENVVREVMSRIGRGDVPDPLTGVQFITPHFSTLTSQVEVEQKLAELRRTVNNCLVGGSAVIYAGDLTWAVDNTNNHRKGDYCPVEHISMELGRIVGSNAAGRRVWLMATASYETYMRCQKRQPSLETLWGLQPVPVPSGGLTLTLQPSSSSQAESKINDDVLFPIPPNIMWPQLPSKTVNPNDELVDKFNWCPECCTKFEEEAEYVRQQENKMVSNDSNLPLWLQQCGNDTISRKTDAAAQVEVKLGALRKKWNQICRTKHSHWDQAQRSTAELRQNSVFSGNSPSHIPWWCAPQIQGHGAHAKRAWSVVSSSRPSSPAWSHHFSQETVRDSSIDSVETDSPRFDVKTTLALGPASSLAWIDLAGSDHPESLKHLGEKLAEKVPWQSEGVVRAVAKAVSHCRRRSMKTWLLALGADRMGKRKMAQALAQIVYGSQDNLIRLASPWSRGRIYDESPVNQSFRGRTYLDSLSQEISINPHCVVLLQDIELADSVFMGAIVKAMETGKLMDSNGREVSLCDSIVFMTSSLGGNYFSYCRSVKGAQFDEDKLSKVIAGPSWGLKLVVQEDQEQEIEKKLGQHPGKRKGLWDLMKVKETEKRNRQSLALDLNVDTDRDAINGAADEQADAGNRDLTTDALSDQILCCARECFPQQFLSSLDRCVVFRPFDFAQLAETIVDKLQHSYCRATNDRGSLEVESSVLERIVSCCWEMAPFDTQTFEKWVLEIFEEGLAQMLSKHTLTAQTVVKLSATTDSHEMDSFYANSSLPTRLEINTCSNHARFNYTISFS
ncbi:hypothetical protein KI387_029015 [Taxus chinensis]|uniref:Clp R domain-containing protein n=1 Tax=Taxus chinensis TaxID=29808 RepID=A0AA38CI51_TAXCH|nr:hypothetical protein KI387_029015 [Taxus chinensis]